MQIITHLWGNPFCDKELLPMRKTVTEALSEFLPLEAVDYIASLLEKNNVQLQVSRERVSKLGDFRPRKGSGMHRISVNGNLNRYEFLLVLLHELSHLIVYRSHGRSVLPHGREWKAVYGGLIREFTEAKMFHPVLQEQLVNYSYKVKAAGVADIPLAMALRMFDKTGNEQDWHYLEEIPQKSLFRVRNGKVFRKGERIRKRFRCFCPENNLSYLIHPMMRVNQTAENDC